MLLLFGILPFTAQAQEDGPEVPAPPRPATSSCRVSCGGDSCATLSPGTASTRDDSADIIECLRQCRCVKLVPDPANGNLKFLVRQPIDFGGMNNPVRLQGSVPAGAQLPLLKATGTCNPIFIESFTDPQGRPRTRYRPVLNLNRVPNGVISDFRVKVADYKQSCMGHTLKETFAVNALNSPGLRIENVRINGQPPARGVDSGGGILGGIQVSFSAGATIRRNKVTDVGYAISDDPTDCLTASGVVGIKVADSGNAIVEDNDVVHSSFGIAVVNENANPNGNTSSGSRVFNNRITGASALQCEILGTFKSGSCDPNTAATDKRKIRCSQGRALRFEGIASNVLQNACAENNWAYQFGGREGQTNASGFDLSGYVSNSRFVGNIFDGRNSHVEFTFQPRANTVNNIVQGNVFLGADTCDVNFQSINGAQVVADQCGLTRKDSGSTISPNSGNNRFEKFATSCGKGTTPPGTCTRAGVPAPPPLPPLPPLGTPPAPKAGACSTF
jgi:hypothetical protein